MQNIFIVINIFTIYYLIEYAKCDEAPPLNHSLILGGYNLCKDDQLYLKNIQKPSSLFRVVVEDVNYPPEGCTQLYNITYISAKEMSEDDNAGFVNLTSGGIGCRNVSLHLKSQRGHGFNFNVEIWGHKVAID